MSTHKEMIISQECRDQLEMISHNYKNANWGCFLMFQIIVSYNGGNIRKKISLADLNFPESDRFEIVPTFGIETTFAEMKTGDLIISKFNDTVYLVMDGTNCAYIDIHAGFTVITIEHVKALAEANAVSDIKIGHLDWDILGA